MKYFISLILISTFHFISFSQEWDWVRQISGQLNDTAHSLDVDDSGFVYVAGRCKYATLFEDELNPIGPLFIGDRDVFVSKYTAEGELVWGVIAGSAQFGYDLAQCVRADNFGGCYITGIHLDSAQFGMDTVYSAGGRDIFVSHLDANGNFDWTKSYGGPTQDNGYGLEIDNQGNLILCGRVHGVVSFEGNNIGTINQYNAFIAKFTSSGTLLDVKGFDSPYSSVLKQVEVDKFNNYYLCGGLNGNAIFNGTSLVTAHSPAWVDAILIKCDSDFNVIWYETGGGNYLDIAYDIAVSDSAIYLSGVYSVTATFDTITTTYNSVETNAASVSTSDMYIASYNPNGGINWFVSGGNEGLDEAWGVTVSPNNNIYASGFFRDSITLGDTTVYSSPGSSNAIIFRLDAEGNVVWVKETGNAGNERGKEIEIDKYENIFECGDFYQTLNFDNIQHTPLNRDGYGGKLTQHTYPSWGVTNTVNCVGDTLILEMSALTFPIQYEYIQLDGNISWVDSNLIYYLVDNAPNFSINGYIKTTNNKYSDSLTIDSIFVVNEIPQFYLAQDTSSCDSAVISVQSGFDTYDWEAGSNNSESITIFSSDTLELMVSNMAGCYTTDTIEVTIYDSPSSILFGDSTTCDQSGNLIIFTDNFYSTYEWSTGVNDTNQISVTTSGLYTVIVLDTNGCSGSSDVNISFVDCAGIQNINLNEPIILNNHLHNFSDDLLINLVVFETSGKQVSLIKNLAPGEEMDLNYLKSGVYILTYGKNRLQSLKFMIQH